MLAAAGAGVVLDDDPLTAQALRAAVAEALTLRSRAGDLWDEVRSAGGAAAAADAVERFAQAGPRR